MGDVHIEEINFDVLISIYFFDIDFLMDTETMFRLGAEKRTDLGMCKDRESHLFYIGAWHIMSLH